jgi:hypothetical protein
MMQEFPGSACWTYCIGHIGPSRQFLGSGPDDVYTAIQDRSEDTAMVNAPENIKIRFLIVRFETLRQSNAALSAIVFVSRALCE